MTTINMVMVIAAGLMVLVMVRDNPLPLTYAGTQRSHVDAPAEEVYSGPYTSTSVAHFRHATAPMLSE